MTTICTLSNSREDDAFLKHCSRPDKLEPFLTDKNLISGWAGALMSLTNSKGGLNANRLQGGLSSEDLVLAVVVSLNPSRHLPPLMIPPSATLALLLSSHNPGANRGTACPGPSLSLFPWLQQSLSNPPPPRPYPSPCSSLLPAPKGRSFCAIYLTESILRSEKCFKPSPHFFSLKIGETEAQRSQERLFYNF